MSAERDRLLTKSGCCTRFGWTRYEFDKNVTDGMPVVAAAGHKGSEWKVDPAAVRRWLARREAEKAAQRRRTEEYLEECRRKADRVVQARWEREQACRAAEQARQEAWLRECEARERGRRLDRAYRVCRRLAYEDYGSPKGAFFPNGQPRFAHEDHPGFMADWPFERPAWWLPPPEMLAAIEAEPVSKPYGYQEPDWRQWAPRYVPGRAWPWRNGDAAPPAADGGHGRAGGALSARQRA
jgi:hypothetical protein